MTDILEIIIRRCQQGNTAAFAEVVARFERPLFGYIYRLGCTPPGRDTEDVVQEIFMKIYQNIQSYQGRAGTAFSTWLFAIARNHCVSLGRRKQLEQKWSQSACLPARQTSDPSDEAVRSESIEQVQQAVAQLPETMRTTFILRYYHDMPYSQIAQILECNEGTVRSRLARAKKAIQQYLSQLSEQH